ncbi:hypothetical protein OHR68_24860 [Spirillospora sp. NBC_00431]
MTTTPQGSALDELRAAYHEQLIRLATERDAARRQARMAQAQADVARADLASLTSRVHELLNAAARHLPDLPAVESSKGPVAQRALPAASGDPEAGDSKAGDSKAGDPEAGASEAGRSEAGKADERPVRAA